VVSARLLNLLSCDRVSDYDAPACGGSAFQPQSGQET
jgi:hypothetical protein